MPVAKLENSGAVPRERRSQKRQRMVLRVGLLSDGRRTSFCLVNNISPTGVRVKLYASIASGSDVTLRVGDEAPVAGRVAWVRDAAAGIEFANALDPGALLRVTQKLPPSSRRSSPRVKTVAKVLLRTGGRSYPGELRDISTSGAKIQVQRRVQLGPSVMITLPGMPPVRSFVRWIADQELGLMFEAPLPIQLIARWIDERVSVSG